MPTLKEIVQSKLTRLETVPESLIGAVEKAEKVMLKEALKLLSELDYKGAALNPTVENLAKIEEITAKLKDILFRGDYIQAVKIFAGEFNKQAIITDAYFEKAFGEFTDESIYKASIQFSQKQAVTLLADTAIDTQFIEPIRVQLAQSITSGSSFSDTVKALTESITGTEQEGKLLRYVKTVSRDSFSISDRTYTKLIADGIGAIWWHYVGGTVKGTREFCRERNNQYFHIEEIKSWAKLEWAGKNKSTNESTILQFLGGHGCLHSALPVSEFVIPESVIQRNIDSGNIKAKAQKQSVSK